MNDSMALKPNITIIELASEIGVSPATLKRWEKCLELEVPLNGESIPVYDEKLQGIMRKVSELRKEGNSFEKIIETLNLPVPKNPITMPEPKKNRAGRLNISSESEDIKTLRKPVFPKVGKEKKIEKPTTLKVKSDDSIVIRRLTLPSFDVPPKKQDEKMMQDDVILESIPEIPSIAEEATEQHEEIKNEIIEDKKNEIKAAVPENISPVMEVTPEPQPEKEEKTEVKEETVEHKTEEPSIEHPLTTEEVSPETQMEKTDEPKEEVNEEPVKADDAIEPHILDPKTLDTQRIEYRDGSEITSAYIELTEAYKTLAAKYSEATFKIGQLEERSRNLTLMLDQKQNEEKQLFLPLQEKVTELTRQVTDKKEEKPAEEEKNKSIEELEKQVKLLTVFLLNDKKKGFWSGVKAFMSRMGKKD